MSLWHRFMHWIGWYRGRSVSWYEGRCLMVGFKCLQCGKMEGVRIARISRRLGRSEQDAR